MVHGSATTMQSAVRGFLARRQARLLLKKRRRGDARLRRERTRAAAATKIQAAVRRRLARYRVRVRELERRLESIEVSRRSELREIERWKAREMQQVQKLIDIRIDEYCGKKAQARVSMDRIEELRRQNVALRDKNVALRNDCADLMEQNSALEVSTALFEKNTKLVRGKMNELLRENVQWQQVNDLYEDRVAEYENWIDERDYRTMLEKKLQKRYQRTVRSMADLVEGCQPEEEDGDDSSSLTLAVLNCMPHSLSGRTVAPPSPRRRSPRHHHAGSGGGQPILGASFFDNKKKKSASSNGSDNEKKQRCPKKSKQLRAVPAL